MLDESYVLMYPQEVIEDMSEEKRFVFQGPMRKFVISTTQDRTLRTIMFHMYQDHFLEAVEKWPWLLCSNLGAHLEKCYNDEEVTYQQATQQLYSTQPPFHVRRKP